MSEINLSAGGVDLRCSAASINAPPVLETGAQQPAERLCPTGRTIVSGAKPTLGAQASNPGNASIALFLSMLASSQDKFWDVVKEQETEVGKMNDLQSALTVLRNAQSGKSNDLAFDEDARNAILNSEITLADDSPLRTAGRKTATAGQILEAYDIGGEYRQLENLRTLKKLTETLSTDVDSRNRTSQLKMLKVNEWQSVVHEYSTFAAEQISKFIEAMTAVARKLS